jgi:hypothetical protein
MCYIDELRKTASIGKMLNPKYHGQDLIRIRCYNDFEGHGRASETWEEHWQLELPQHQYYWKSTKGWRMGKRGITMTFHGRTFDECIKKAVSFLTNVGEEARSTEVRDE